MTGKYEFIDAEYDAATEAGTAPTIMQMCRWTGVSKSGYYEWRSRPESATAARRELLKIKIKALFEANDETYGVAADPRCLGARRRAGQRRAGPPAHAGAWAWCRASRGRGGSPHRPGRPPGARHARPCQPRLHRGGARRENGRRRHLLGPVCGYAQSGRGHGCRCWPACCLAGVIAAHNRRLPCIRSVRETRSS